MNGLAPTARPLITATVRTSLLSLKLCPACARAYTRSIFQTPKRAISYPLLRGTGMRNVSGAKRLSNMSGIKSDLRADVKPHAYFLAWF